MYAPLYLARMQAQSLFELNREGRMVRIREPEPNDPPPRFALIRTWEGHVALTRHDVPETIAARLFELAEREAPLRDPLAPPQYLDAYIETLNEHAPVEKTYAGPAYVLPAGESIHGETALISAQNAALLERHFTWAPRHLGAYSPVCAVVEDGAAVAICFCAREPSPGVEAGVFTAEAYRRRGYALRAVAAWAHELSSQGCVPLFSTSWDNTASRRIAERLGGELYAVDFSIT